MGYMDNINKEFEFRGKTLIVGKIREWKSIKVYKQSSHLDRVLVQDEDGNLYLYEFYEKVNFDRDDEIINTYVLVKDEAEADKLDKEQFIFRKDSFRFNADMSITVA